MAEEKLVADEATKAEAEYRRQLAEHMKGDIEKLGISTEEKKPEEPPKEEGDEAKDEPEDTDSEEEKEPEGDEEAEGEGDEEKGKYSKAFRKLQKQEAELQSFKSQVLAQERDLKQREQKIQATQTELTTWIKQLQVDPFGTLLKAGLINEDDAEYASKQLYYHSKTAASDPKNKLEAERLRRERELLLEQRQTRAQLERMERERQAEKAEAQQKQETDAYVAKIESTVSAYKAKTPLLAQALEKNPTRTRQELFKIAHDLSAAKGEFADPGLVVLAWTKQRKQLLADHGIKEPVASSEKVQSKSAAEKKGPTNGKSNGSTAQKPTDDADAADAAYRKKLAAMLKGEEVDD